MNTSTPYAELFIAENDHAAAARERAVDYGCEPVGVGTGAALAFLAATVAANNVVEIGTGTGVSGLHLFDGMASDGILTSIDIETEHQRAAKQAFTAAGIAPGRARLINGRALDVLPRLTDGAYDLVLVDGAPQEYTAYLTEAVRLLRPGGILALAHALEAGAVREAGHTIRDDETLISVLMPLGGGLLAAVKH